MIRRKYSVLVLLAVFLFTFNTGYALADTGSAESEELSLEQAVTLAQKNSPEIRQADYDIDKSWEYRELAAAATNLRIPPGPISSEIWNIYNTANLTDAQWRMAKCQKELVEDSVYMETVKKYYTVLDARDKLQQIERDLEYEKWEQEVSQLKLSLGLASPFATETKAMQYTVNQDQYKKAKEDLEQAYIDLNRQLGVNKDKRYILTTEISFEPMEIDDLDIEIMKVMQDNPSSRLAGLNIYLAEINKDMEPSGQPQAESYKAKQIDVKKAELQEQEARKAMEQGMRDMYTNVLQIERSYTMLQQQLELQEKALEIVSLQHELGMVDKGKVLKQEKEVEDIKASFNQIARQHELLKEIFYMPWAYNPGQGH